MRYWLFICCLCLLVSNPLQANLGAAYSVAVSQPPVEPIYSAEALPPLESNRAKPLPGELITALIMLNGMISLLGLVFFPIAVFNGWLMLANWLLYAEGFSFLLGLLFLVFFHTPGAHNGQELVLAAMWLLLVLKGVELLLLGLIFRASWMIWAGIGYLLPIVLFYLFIMVMFLFDKDDE